MRLRIARHTTDLQRITSFYREVLGLERLGGFNDHQNYDGVFIGLKDENWHLEFTISNEAPDHKPDDDDLLVFYVDNREQYDILATKIKNMGIKTVMPKNPYWEKNGTTIADPDGYRVVIAISQ